MASASGCGHADLDAMNFRPLLSATTAITLRHHLDPRSGNEKMKQINFLLGVLVMQLALACVSHARSASKDEIDLFRSDQTSTLSVMNLWLPRSLPGGYTRELGTCQDDDPISPKCTGFSILNGEFRTELRNGRGEKLTIRVIDNTRASLGQIKTFPFGSEASDADECVNSGADLSPKIEVREGRRTYRCDFGGFSWRATELTARHVIGISVKTSDMAAIIAAIDFGKLDRKLRGLN